MRFCNLEECEKYACCNHCINMDYVGDFEYYCMLTGEDVDPLDICEDFDCCLNYPEEDKL